MAGPPIRLVTNSRTVHGHRSDDGTDTEEARGWRPTRRGSVVSPAAAATP